MFLPVQQWNHQQSDHSWLLWSSDSAATVCLSSRSQSPVFLDPVAPWWSSRSIPARPRTLCAPIYSHKDARCFRSRPLWRQQHCRSATSDVHLTAPVGSAEKRTSSRFVLRRQCSDLSIVRKLDLLPGQDERSDEESVHLRALEESRACEFKIFLVCLMMFWVDTSRLEYFLILFFYYLFVFQLFIRDWPSFTSSLFCAATEAEVSSASLDS